ncbi:hypothetical protein THAR02_01905 [Trichoderma harzianum]|uniref:Uncharacterized protein n=1 Tax=Trichoderma harzianum TaxID=5544 RepID=A0A0F9Y1N9_TRIHA|nr:hypothetical protein THAR02_01905 [Trichoderma harzianum]
MQRRQCKSKPSPARSGTVQSGVEDSGAQRRESRRAASERASERLRGYEHTALREQQCAVAVPVSHVQSCTVLVALARRERWCWAGAGAGAGAHPSCRTSAELNCRKKLAQRAALISAPGDRGNRR